MSIPGRPGYGQKTNRGNKKNNHLLILWNRKTFSITVKNKQGITALQRGKHY
jgi:hypothetical protein